MTEPPPTSLRPPLGLVLGTLLRADTAVLLRNRFSGLLSILLPLVILVANTLGKSQSRLGGTNLLIGLALTLGLIPQPCWATRLRWPTTATPACCNGSG